MDKVDILKRALFLFDKELDDTQKAISYGDEYGMLCLTFSEAKEELQKENPDVDWIIEYCAEIIYYEFFSFCGCGRPGGVINYILDLLECFDNDGIDGSTFFNWDRYIGKFSYLPEKYDVSTEFILKVFDSIGLTDHGTGIYSSWLSDKGVICRDILKLWKEMQDRDAEEDEK